MKYPVFLSFSEFADKLLYLREVAGGAVVGGLGGRPSCVREEISFCRLKVSHNDSSLVEGS